MTAMQRMEAAIATAFPSFPHHPPSSLSGPVRNRAGLLSDDPSLCAAQDARVDGTDVGRASLRGDEHPESPSSGTATVASPPPGGGRHVLDRRAA
jgi:hypothetical protein